jgi:hypothetical protein
VKFLFVDESERQKSKTSREFFFLCGLIVPEASVMGLSSKLLHIASDHKLKSLKDLRGKVPRERKMKITSEVFDTLCSHQTQVICTALGRQALRKEGRLSECYLDALEFMLERFFIQLQKDNDWGLIIFDNVNADVEREFIGKTYEIISTQPQRMRGTVRGYFRDRIYPQVLLGDDAYSPILQAADLIALSLNSAFYRGKVDQRFDLERLAEHNEYLAVYWPLFVKSPEVKVAGWGIKVWW